MPLPGITPPLHHGQDSPFLKGDPEIRMAEKVFERPGWLEGYKTWIGIALFIISAIGKRFQVDIPADQIVGFLDWLNNNWTVFADGVAGLMAIWGTISKSIRMKRAKTTVAVVANKLVDTSHELTQVKTAVAKAPIADAAKAQILEPVKT